MSEINKLQVIKTSKIDIQSAAFDGKNEVMLKAAIANNMRAEMRISANEKREGYERDAKIAIYNDVRECLALLGLSKLPEKKELQAVLVPIVNTLYESCKWIIPGNKEVSEAVKMASLKKISFETNTFGQIPGLPFFLGLMNEYKAVKLKDEAEAKRVYDEWKDEKENQEYLKQAPIRVAESLAGILAFICKGEPEVTGVSDWPQYLRFGFGYDILDGCGLLSFSKEEKLEAVKRADDMIAKKDAADAARNPIQSTAIKLMPDEMKKNRRNNAAKDILFTVFVNEAWKGGYLAGIAEKIAGKAKEMRKELNKF